MLFEVRHTDLAARIGKLETRKGVIETPAFVPVIHPVRQVVDVDFIKRLGFDIVITNAYITLRHYGKKAIDRGIQNIINYDGTIMTDSGGYQVLEYGSVDVTPSEMSIYECEIGSDICVPLDKPTGYGLEYNKAKEYVNITLQNCKDTIDTLKQWKNNNRSKNDKNEIWVGPIQGAEHLDLVEYSVKELNHMNFELMAIGSPVEVMESYDFKTLANMIATVKRLVPSKPIHLFGAGHPLTIPLAVALGCDLFDSASYLLYARQNRYLSPNGTHRLEDLSYLPCSCPICVRYDIKDFLSLGKEERLIELAKHNLYILRSEVICVKQSIIDGRLWEYLLQKARSHPKLMDAVRILKDFEFLEYGTPLFKDKALFLFDHDDLYRPELIRYRKKLDFYRSFHKTLVLYPDLDLRPFYLSNLHKRLLNSDDDCQVCLYNPYLGLIPAEISDVYPASHRLISKENIIGKQIRFSFTSTLEKFIQNNSFTDIIIYADVFMKDILQNSDISKTFSNILVKDYEQ